MNITELNDNTDKSYKKKDGKGTRLTAARQVAQTETCYNNYYN